MEHPVVNDRDFAVWRSWGANAWPTTVLIDPAGNVVGGHSGEGVYDVMQPIITSLVSEFDQKGVLDRTPLELAREVDGRSDTVLSFPGKVFAAPATGTLYIADTGHHRIVAADPTSGDVLAVYGSGKAGYREGAATEAAFSSPQGMALSPDGRILYVADTNNHAVRSIDLATGNVGTALGTGRIGWPPVGGRATEVAISSPWALEQKDGKLFIAMAGHHQIWEMDLAADIARPLVGNSRESTFNGPLAQAELAQPSGLAFDADGLLYFADSESSAIRSAQVDRSDGVTDVVVGSDANLFDFGDVDGIGTAARLQHPLGLAFAADGFMYVADTYNSKLKRIDLGRREITTFLGGEQGWQDGDDARFYEPGGLAAAGSLLYVADTNNHVVRVVDLTAATTTTLVLKGIERFQPAPDNADYQGEIVEVAAVSVAPGRGSVELAVTLPPEHKVNEDAPSSAEFFVVGGIANFADANSISLTGAKFPVTVPVQWTAGEGTVTADLTVIYCREGAESLCFIQQLRLIAPVTVVADGPGEHLEGWSRRRGLRAGRDSRRYRLGLVRRLAGRARPPVAPAGGVPRSRPLHRPGPGRPHRNARSHLRCLVVGLLEDRDLHTPDEIGDEVVKHGTERHGRGGDDRPHHGQEDHDAAPGFPLDHKRDLHLVEEIRDGTRDPLLEQQRPHHPETEHEHKSGDGVENQRHLENGPWIESADDSTNSANSHQATISSERPDCTGQPSYRVISRET